MDCIRYYRSVTYVILLRVFALSYGLNADIGNRINIVWVAKLLTKEFNRTVRGIVTVR